MSIELWGLGKHMLTRPDFRDAVLEGRVAPEQIVRGVIVVDHGNGVESNRRVVTLEDWLRTRYDTRPRKQELVSDVRKHAAHLAKCADALETIMGLNGNTGAS